MRLARGNFPEFGFFFQRRGPIYSSFLFACFELRGGVAWQVKFSIAGWPGNASEWEECEFYTFVGWPVLRAPQLADGNVEWRRESL